MVDRTKRPGQKKLLEALRAYRNVVRIAIAHTIGEAILRLEIQPLLLRMVVHEE